LSTTELTFVSIFLAIRHRFDHSFNRFSKTKSPAGGSRRLQII
jgi:hypothetical protein